MFRRKILAVWVVITALTVILVLTTYNNGDSNAESNYESPSGPEWHIVVVDRAGIVGGFTSLAVVNGNPAISYTDRTNGDLKYAYLPAGL